MASCDQCGRLILFGGKRSGDRVYCGARCASYDAEIALGRSLPDAQVREVMQRWRNEPCPQCNGPGPVDLRVSHKVHSFVFMTQWSSPQAICCRHCARKRQLGHAVYSLLLGWWGFPWGLVMTPVQVTRNLKALFGDQAAQASTPAFERAVRRIMVRQLQAQHQQESEAGSA
ncbi:MULTISPECIES: hypothetical protein [Oleiagrimonas]|jgi:hypothetical protein|uniref:Uncharacterized protein n=1 Tax=Oleiagrimonas citrea TaxID=1665687 RepID=A0A846ZKJ1_9GAMM|nr:MULTISPECIES: hypothetical protein [Oleiagrimonas]NKZ38694.1 hypothetical protein [Oleiagrimonas citrea]RAP56208.1 hypothetical protein BTJ49_14220 [Oleiagrimonas sp. MCCC 1A03011]